MFNLYCLRKSSLGVYVCIEHLENGNHITEATLDLAGFTVGPMANQCGPDNRVQGPTEPSASSQDMLSGSSYFYTWAGNDEQGVIIGHNCVAETHLILFYRQLELCLVHSATSFPSHRVETGMLAEFLLLHTQSFGNTENYSPPPPAQCRVIPKSKVGKWCFYLESRKVKI